MVFSKLRTERDEFIQAVVFNPELRTWLDETHLIKKVPI